ncbi:MAG: thioredoxin [Bacteroidaceae bacterium]|nr:thioredoxin [Bacteroidaceae bacterium]
MNKVLLILVLSMGMVACSGAKDKSVSGQTKKDVVEVLYFHRAQRCATCIAIERNAMELVNKTFSESLNSGRLVFRSMDIGKEKALAEKYEVSWSSLVLVDFDKGGKESSINLTEFAFKNVRNDPDRFKSVLLEHIAEMLSN